MSVQIQVSKTLGGGTVNDILSGGVGGYYVGAAQSGLFCAPSDMYINHNGANEILDISVYIAPFSQFYGGNVTAGSNYLQMAIWGGLGFGLQLSEQAFGADNFNFIFDGSNGFNFDTKKMLLTTAMIYNNAGVATVPTLPVDGVIGATGDAVKGDVAYVKLKAGTPSPPAYIGGAIQFDFIYFYHFSS